MLPQRGRTREPYSRRPADAGDVSQSTLSLQPPGAARPAGFLEFNPAHPSSSA